MAQPEQWQPPQDKATGESRGRRWAAPPPPLRASTLPGAVATATAVAAQTAPMAGAARAAPPTSVAPTTVVVEAHAALADGAAPTAPQAVAVAPAHPVPLASAAAPAGDAAPLFLLFLLFLFPPLLLLLLVLPLLCFLNRMEPNGPWRPSLDLRGLNPLVHDTSASRARAVPGLITNSDGVTHSPRLGRLGGSLLTLGARRLTLSRGR